MSVATVVAGVRNGAGLFELPARGLIEVAGADRTRWLNGMVSNDVAVLEPGPERSGCAAVLLSPQGRIIADFHVMHCGEVFWLETATAAVAGALERMERLVIADDVKLEDVSPQWLRLGLEGPLAPAILDAAAGRALPLGADCAAPVEIGAVPAVVAAFAFCGMPARQLFVPRERGEAVRAALRQAATETGATLLEPDETVFEILRIEAGTPMFGSELAEDTLPDEARLEHAVSDRKGCYTGQEIVARLRSRGGVKHRLVGLLAGEVVHASGPALPEPGTALERAAGGSPGRRTGEITSRCVSPRLGPIGLGFVHRDDARPGTWLRAGGITLEVVDLPFPGPGGGRGGGAER